MHQKILIAFLAAALLALALSFGCHFFGENDDCEIEAETDQADDDNADVNDDANEDANDDADDDNDDDVDDDVNDDADDDADDDNSTGSFRLMSPTFTQGDLMPGLYTCDTNNPDYPTGLSPPLGWVYAPDEAQSLAVVMTNTAQDDRVHWALINIPTDCQYLDEGLSPKSTELPGNSWETWSDYGERGYWGPCPPVGTFYSYNISIFALDSVIDMPASQPFTYAIIQQRVEDATIDSSEIEFAYQR